MFKVLNSDLTSPFKNFQYEMEKEYICENFDDSNKECSRGFYATNVEGLIYCFIKGRKVFEVEVSGREKRFNQFKHRFEKQTILREISEEELKKLLEDESHIVGYNLLGLCFPINPFEIEHDRITQLDIDNLKKWISVRKFVFNSVEDSLIENSTESTRDFVWYALMDSLWELLLEPIENSIKILSESSKKYLIELSLRDSLKAYQSSIFHNIKEWRYIKHELGVNPFQCCYS